MGQSMVGIGTGVLATCLCLAGLDAQRTVADAAPADDAPQRSSSSASPMPPAADRPARTDRYGDLLPIGAVARLGTVRFRHGHWHKGLQFLPDSETFLTSAEDHRIRFWDVQSGKEVRRIEVPDLELRLVRLSRDGQMLAAVGFHFDRERRVMEHVIQLWETDTGQLRSTIRWDSERGGVTAIAFTPDARTIVTGNQNNELRFWNVATGQEVRNYATNQRNIQSLDFSPDGALLAVGCSDQPLLWDWRSDNAPVALGAKPQRSLFHTAAFSPDGALLATLCHGEYGVQLWDVRSRREVRRLRRDGVRYYPSQFAFTPDGRRLAVPNHQKEIELWDTTTGKLLQVFECGAAEARFVTMSPDGQWLAAIGRSAIKVWNLRTGQSVSERYQGHEETPSEMVVTPDGKTVVTAGMDGTARVWEAVNGQQLRVLQHQGWIRGLALSPDAKWVASSSLDDTLGVWELDTGRRIYSLSGHGKVGGHRALAFSPDGARLFSWGDDMDLRIWDMRTGKALSEFPLRPKGIQFPVDEDGRIPVGRDLQLHSLLYGGYFSRDAKLFLLETAQTVRVFDAETGRELRTVGPLDRFVGSALSPDGRVFVGGHRGADRQIPLADGRVRFEGSRDGTFRVQDFASGELRYEVALTDAYFNRPVCSPDGRWLALADRGWEGTVYILDAATGTEQFRIAGIPSQINGVVFSPDGTRLVTSHSDGTALVWNLEAFRLPPEP